MGRWVCYKCWLISQRVYAWFSVAIPGGSQLLQLQFQDTEHFWPHRPKRACGTHGVCGYSHRCTKQNVWQTITKQSRYGGSCLQLPSTPRQRGQRIRTSRATRDPVLNRQQWQTVQGRQIHRSREHTDDLLKAWEEACARVWFAGFALRL